MQEDSSLPHVGKERQAQRTQRARKLVYWLVGGALAVFALLWAVWGFRWPPTVEVISDERPATEEAPMRAKLDRQEELLGEIESGQEGVESRMDGTSP